MRTRGQHRTGAVALAGLAILAVGAGAPAQAAEQPRPSTQPSTDQTAEPKPTPDTTAPQRPALGEASTEPGGTVNLPVQAEGGSALVVREGTEVVASASALGTSQTLSWDATTGPHTYLVVSTDAAGNVSDAASLTIDVDATPPTAERFVVRPGTARDSRSSWGVATEPGTAYRLLVDGATVAEGTTEQRVTRQHLDLADGSHALRLELRDEAGNLRTVAETVTVDIPTLWVAAKDVSADNAAERTFRIASAPGTRGLLRIPGAGAERFELPEGRAEVTVEVPEGSYSSPVVVVADDRNRKGTTQLSPFAVDMTAPALEVVADAAAGDRGMISAGITAGAGDTVLWRVLDDRGIAILSGEYLADGTEQRLDREVAEGRYDLEVTATDAMGNQATDKVTTGVTGKPMINPDVVPALVITLVLWVLVGVAMLVRRRRRQVAADRQAVVDHDEELELLQWEAQVWQQRHEVLTQLVSVARGGAVEVAESTVALRADERALCNVPARLVQIETVDGVEVPVEVEDGRLVITDARIAFAGATEQQEWELAELEQLRHVGQDRTMIKVSDCDGVSGVAYADADLVRFYFELATAEGDALRTVHAMLAQAVRSHELRRPELPAAAGESAADEGATEAPAGEVPVEQPAGWAPPATVAPHVVVQGQRVAEARELQLQG